MISASVSNIELFRDWSASEDCPYCGGNGCSACDNQGYRDAEWLLKRLRGEEPESQQMKAGSALHSFLENANPDTDAYTLEGEFEGSYYRFDFNCDCQIVWQPMRELSVEKEYGGLLVRGRVDGINGKRITDYKTTSRFDPEHLFEGVQWRFYLDMMAADEFQWVVFVLKEFGAPGCYEINQVHDLRQHRYPGLHESCAAIAKAYEAFVSALPPERWQRKSLLQQPPAAA